MHIKLCSKEWSKLKNAWKNRVFMNIWYQTRFKKLEIFEFWNPSSSWVEFEFWHQTQKNSIVSKNWVLRFRVELCNWLSSMQFQTGIGITSEQWGNCQWLLESESQESQFCVIVITGITRIMNICRIKPHRTTWNCIDFFYLSTHEYLPLQCSFMQFYQFYKCIELLESQKTVKLRVLTFFWNRNSLTSLNRQKCWNQNHWKC